MTAEQILEMLMTQTFADFFKGDLDSFITGEEDAMTKEEIIKEIRKMKDDVCPGRAARKQGRSPEEIKAGMDDCMSGDYNHLLEDLTVLVGHTL